MQNEPHIPTLAGILILLVGMAATIFLIENSSRLFTRAAPDEHPQQVTVTNITDTSLVVSWITQNRTYGLIKYKEKNPLSTYKQAYDHRDSQTQSSPRYTHYVNIAGLLPNTNYDITIVSNNREYPDNKIAINTGSLLPPPDRAANLSFGTLIDQRNHPVSEALAYVSFEGSQLISSLVNSDGSWVLPLGELRSSALNRYFVPTKNDQERFFFITADSQSTVVATIDNDSPLPAIRIGENYDFTKSSSLKTNHVIFAQGKTNTTVSGTVSSSLTIDLPQQSANIPSGKPAFKGTATADKKVIIALSGPTTISEKITSSPNGNWSWTPKETLAPGKYIVTVVSFNSSNTPVSQAVGFTILKSGTSVLGDATPSASLVPTPVPTPSPVFSPSPSASATVLITGNWEPTVGVLALGFILFIFGSLSFAKNSKKAY